MGKAEEKNVVKISENKQIFLKSLFFMLSIFLLLNVIFLLWDSAFIVEGVAIFSLAGSFLVATPVYFFMKSNVKNFWRYWVNMLVVYIILFLLEFATAFILDLVGFFTDWESLFLIAASIVFLIIGGIILLLDLSHNVYISITQGKK